MEEANSRRNSWSKEEASIELTNHLIILCNLTFPRVSSLSDINSQLFTLLFETITGVVLHDLIPEPRSIEDEAHNIQTVIDTLSLDILNISLSHIIGEDIVKQNAISIYNLLEVMENYLLYSVQSTAQSEDKIEAERDEFVSGDEHPAASSISTWTQTDAIFEEMLYPQQKENVTSLAGNNEEIDHSKRNSEIICPLCTLTSEQTDDIKQINGEENIKEIADILKEIGNQSVYKKLSAKHDSITSIKHPYIKSSSSSSTTVLPEQDTTSSSFVSPIIAESQNGIHPPSPAFSKVIRESSEGKSSVGSTDKSSQTLSGKTESSSETSGIPQIRTQMLRKIATLKKRRQESSDSSEKNAKKKNVRFSSKDALKDFDAKNLQNYKEKVKDDLENFQTISESSEFVNDVYKDIFNAPQQKFPPVYKRYICRTRTKHPSISKRSPNNNKHIREISAGKEESTSENEFLQYLQKEMPGIYLSPATKRRMQNQYHQHLRLIGNQLRDYNSRKTKTEKQYEEAMRKKEKLSRILKKERDHNQRMKRLKEERQLHQRVKSTLRDNQMNRIQMKQSYDDHQQFLKSKLNRKKTKEEKLMRELYEEGLAIQKEELRELRKLAKEREEKEARNHQIYMESMENFYKNQLEMLTETINEEKNKLKQSAKAQTRVLEQIRRDFRNKMEQEIKDSRNRLLAGDIHFRELDAERIKNSWKKKGIRILPSTWAHKGRKY